jgi:hypothetical protein
LNLTVCWSGKTLTLGKVAAEDPLTWKKLRSGTGKEVGLREVTGLVSGLTDNLLIII